MSDSSRGEARNCRREVPRSCSSRRGSRTRGIFSRRFRLLDLTLAACATRPLASATMPTLAERRRREAQEAALQGKIGADPLRFSHANGRSNSTAPPPSRDARDAASRRLSSAQPAAYAAVGAAASGAPPSPPPNRRMSAAAKVRPQNAGDHRSYAQRKAHAARLPEKVGSGKNWAAVNAAAQAVQPSDAELVYAHAQQGGGRLGRQPARRVAARRLATAPPRRNAPFLSAANPLHPLLAGIDFRTAASIDGGGDDGDSDLSAVATSPEQQARRLSTAQVTRPRARFSARNFVVARCGRATRPPRCDRDSLASDAHAPPSLHAARRPPHRRRRSHWRPAAQGVAAHFVPRLARPPPRRRSPRREIGGARPGDTALDLQRRRPHRRRRRRRRRWLWRRRRRRRRWREWHTAGSASHAEAFPEREMFKARKGSLTRAGGSTKNLTNLLGSVEFGKGGHAGSCEVRSRPSRAHVLAFSSTPLAAPPAGIHASRTGRCRGAHQLRGRRTDLCPATTSPRPATRPRRRQRHPQSADPAARRDRDLGRQLRQSRTTPCPAGAPLPPAHVRAADGGGESPNDVPAAAQAVEPRRMYPRHSEGGVRWRPIDACGRRCGRAVSRRLRARRVQRREPSRTSPAFSLRREKPPSLVAVPTDGLALAEPSKESASLPKSTLLTARRLREELARCEQARKARPQCCAVK